MTPSELLRTRRALKTVAAREGTTVAQVKQNIQEAINEAWASPVGHTAQQRLFPGGKPTVEEFLITVTAYVNVKL